MAKIIPLKKPGKPDYTDPNAFRPISLLSTLSKAVEAVIAERISYLVERHGLLPLNHYGALKRKSTTDALLTIQEKIYQAWRDKKVLSLVTFDLKGAFNGVAIDILLGCLWAHRIPEDYVQWIQDFCSERSATITVNGHISVPQLLKHPGLPQGSPLSPLLFLFFNAELVKSVINKNRGAIAFVDDYSAWVTGDSIESNVTRLQTQVVSPLERWAATSGVIFRADKSYMTHFTRNKKKLLAPGEDSSLTLNGTGIKPSPRLKLLGVVLDQRLRYREHIGNVAKKGVLATLALKRLRNLRPETVRRLYNSTVVPVIDYASVIWAPNAPKFALSPLVQVQRMGARAIVGAFRTVSLLVAESEAAILPFERRFLTTQLTTWVKWHAKPSSHRFWKIKRTIDLSNKRWISPLQKMAEKFKALDLEKMEKIEAFVKAPWVPPVQVNIFGREKAIQKAKDFNPRDPVVLGLNGGAAYAGLTFLGQ